MRRFNNVWAVLAAVTAASLLWKTQEVADGVRAGLASCAGIIIPSLFPFMILAGLISSTQAGAVLSRAVSMVTRRLFGLPDALGAALLMSFVGGYPVGARMLSTMLERREISRENAQRALCFCVNAGPSFLVSAIGAGMLGSRSAGLLLLTAQTLSSLTVAAFVFRGGRGFRGPGGAIRAPAGIIPGREPFVEAVRGASSGILGVCSFVVAFSAITALLRALGVLGAVSGAFAALLPGGKQFYSAALTGILEVTNGCAAASALHTASGFVLCAFLVSFSSLSIIFQTKACFLSECGLSFSQFYRSRIVHGMLTALIALPLSRLLPAECFLASVSTSAPIPQATPNMAVTAVCLICMCTILLLSPGRRRENVNIST